MLGLNQLIGFGSVSGSKDGVLSASLLTSKTSISAAEISLDLAATPFTWTAFKTYVVAMAADNSGTNGASAFEAAGLGFESSDPDFSPYRIDQTQDPGAASAGVTLAAACDYYNGATAVDGGYTLVQFVGGVEPASKAAILIEVSNSNATPATFAYATSNSGNGTAPTVSADLLTGDLMIGLLGSEGRVAPTADGGAGWTSRIGAIADTSTAGTSITIHAQTYLATTDETKTWAPTFGSARDYVIGCIVLRPEA